MKLGKFIVVSPEPIVLYGVIEIFSLQNNLYSRWGLQFKGCPEFCHVSNKKRNVDTIRIFLDVVEFHDKIVVLLRKKLEIHGAIKIITGSLIFIIYKHVIHPIRTVLGPFLVWTNHIEVLYLHIFIHSYTSEVVIVANLDFYFSFCSYE